MIAEHAATNGLTAKDHAGYAESGYDILKIPFKKEKYGDAAKVAMEVLKHGRPWFCNVPSSG